MLAFVQEKLHSILLDNDDSASVEGVPLEEAEWESAFAIPHGDWRTIVDQTLQLESKAETKRHHVALCHPSLSLWMLEG